MPLLLDVWREACRHIEIEEFAARIAPLLAQRLPLQLLVIQRIDAQRRAVETVAATGSDRSRQPTIHRIEHSAQSMEDLLVWCGKREIVRGTGTGDAPDRLRLLPASVKGHFLAGPLTVEAAAAGLLLVITRSSKPFTREHERMVRELLDPFSTALENDQRLREIRTLREAAEADKLSALSRLGRQSLKDTIVGAELGLKPVMERVDLVARSDVPVLILGETGSGKEVVARAIHDRSPRAAGPFLRVNCGAITPELIDSELFGHERGSFTGAVNARKGWFERADRGTLLLDEIGELPLPAQVRLLRILQDGSFERVGGERQLHADVRVVAATHRDLRSMIREGQFREDLWYRIAVFPIPLPPLRERLADIPALAIHFALRASRRFGTRPLSPSPDDLRLLSSYPWPGNVRELAAVMDRAVILGDGNRLEVAKALGTPPPASPPNPSIAPSDMGAEEGARSLATLNHAMARHIESALAKTGGRIEGPHGAARILDINPHTLRARMRRLGVDWRRFRNRGSED